MKKSILFIFTASSCSPVPAPTSWMKSTRRSIVRIRIRNTGRAKLAVNALYTLQRYYANDTENATVFALERGTDLAVTNGGTATAMNPMRAGAEKSGGIHVA